MTDTNAVTIIAFSGDLDKLFASFTIATGAAASGMKVNMFFTFWGLKLIQQVGTKSKDMNWMQKMLGWMVKPGSEKRSLSKMNMLGAGPMMLKKLMKKSNVPSLTELMAAAKSLGVKMTACTTSMQVMGIDKQSLIPEVDNVAGVASFLAEAKESSMTLFI